MSKDLTSLFDDAIKASLPEWTQELKEQYRKAGAKSVDASTVQVHTSDVGAKVDGDRNVWDIEFGTQDTPPAAVARNYGNNSPKGAAALLRNLESKLGEL